MSDCCVYLGAALAEYGFGPGHPFGNDRLGAFQREFENQGLNRHVELRQPVRASEADLRLFHTAGYVDLLRKKSLAGSGILDAGDTPVFRGVFEAACTVAGSVLDAVGALMRGACSGAFVPIAGLHHARRDSAAGFCAINDCGIAIEALQQRYGLQRIAYVDIDAHHGDGVFYAFEDNPRVLTIDFHEDGRYLYPGTGAITETGSGAARGSKLNVPLPPGATDRIFLDLWPKAEALLQKFRPEFIMLQAGADSVQGDPITHLALTPQIHRYVTKRLRALADDCCQGRLLALGGGGYNRQNLALAWTGVVAAMLGQDG